MRTLAETAAANRAGQPIGIPSYCTAHAETLQAILATYARDDQPILIEATCNQVNQFGGYTGMTPSGFRNFIDILAAGEGVDSTRVIFGGDHLGPNPWKAESASAAMTKAKAMVAAYVEAGFSKIHLDASMACADDKALSDETRARRAAELCAVAEAASGGRQLSYVIGTEVPVPGGETGGFGGIAVTKPEAAQRTFELHEAAFSAIGLGNALDRVIGIVVQPGVDFGNANIMAFDPAAAVELSDTIFDIPNAVFEAHSTDYQSEASLAALVKSHFGILKVGPELTFAFREAVVAMANIESHLDVPRSNVLGIIDEEMEADPVAWKSYIPDDSRAAEMRIFGLSDRIRYYWPHPRIASAVQRLFANIDGAHPEAGIVWQYAPGLDVEATDAQALSARIIASRVGTVVERYRRATATA